MNIEDVKVNSRVQIEREILRGESYSGGIIETYKGIVMEVAKDRIILVSDYGEEVHIRKDDILSIGKFVFDKNVSASMNKLKAFYLEKRELIKRLQELTRKEKELVETLLDSNMIAKFNILGAKNRLIKSIDKSLLEFTRGLYLYAVTFHVGEKDHLEIAFKVSNVLEHYLHEIEVDALIRTHAPQEKELLEKIFHEIGKIEDVENCVNHVEGNIYEVISRYRLKVELTKDNYIETRAAIINGLIGLRK